ncbi:MAG: hypothetical protein IH623_32235 [Verrucomicrobia bacterium]|nr:hypothetical protein [Verrucomicrobiota bacterium]
MGLSFCVGWCLEAGAQLNSWTGAGSGYWENPDWSLGALPGTNQTILFTNAGWKVLEITANTAQNLPQTLSVDSITIASPTNSFNTVWLNHAGFVTPLTANSLTVASNSAVVMASSALRVAGDLSVSGTFTEIEGSEVSVGSLHLGDLGPAVYNLTNSTLSTGEEYIGGFPSTFNQQGGMNSGRLYLQSAGQYNLFDGSVGGWTLQIEGGSFNLFGGSVNKYEFQVNSGSCNLFDGSVHVNYFNLQGGTFNQWGGNMSAFYSIRFARGGYHLAGGTLSSGGMQIPVPLPNGSEFSFSFLQTGGTNFTSSISLGPRSARGEYSLSGGVLIASSLHIYADGRLHASGTGMTSMFYQGGGFHTNGGISIRGFINHYGRVNSSVYYLSDGLLSTPLIGLTMGAFQQSGGTNSVGTVSLGMVSSYQLSGGWLTATNIYQSGGVVYTPNPYDGGQFDSFQQSGGTNQVSDTLWLGGHSKNGMSGGRLIAQNLQVNGGASFLHSGGTISIPGVLTLGNGTWDEQTAGGEQFGTLQLADGSSTLLLPANGACILHFGDSSSRSWTAQAVLVIKRWDGSSLGNGKHQIAFGNSPSGLTAQQLNQIQFHNPANMAAGTYPARILATGEIVPDALSSEHNGQQLVLYWGSDWTLQTTTNLAESFIDLANATSPYTNYFTDPKRFFRLRR